MGRRKKPQPRYALDHMVCPYCGWDTALCGEDVSYYEWAPTSDPLETCRVCLDLRKKPCLNCGGSFK